MFLNQILTSAIQNNPEIQTERTHLKTSKAEAFAAASILNPFFLFDVDFGEEIYRFGLQKTIELGGIQKIRKEVIQKRVDLREAQLNIRIIELKKKVKDAFASLYINQQKIKYLEETYDYISLKIKEKTPVSEIDQLLIEEKILNIKQKLEDAEIAVEKAELILETLIGKELEDGAELKSPTEAELEKKFNLEELIKTALQKRPSIIENDKELILAKSLKKLAKADRWPLIIADSGARVFMKRNQASGFLGIDIELPILGLEKKEIEVSNVRIKQVKDIRETLEKKIELEVENSFNIYNFAKKRLTHYKEKHLPRIEELILIIREKYEQGELSGREFLIAEKSRLSILENYYKALYDFEDAFSDLERAVGITLLEGKRQPELINKNLIIQF